MGKNHSEGPLRGALALHQLGRLAEAEAAYRRVLVAHPSDVEALQLLGAACLQTHRYEEAADLLRRSLGARPHAPEVLNNLGIALEGAGRLAESEAAYRSAVRVRPDYVDALNNLGNTLRKLGRFEEAERTYIAALRHRPLNAVTHACLGATALEKGDLDDALKHYWRAASLRPDDAAAHSDLLFWLLHHPRYSDRQIFDAHLKWAGRHCAGVARLAPLPEPTAAQASPLRVGYVSPDFREHTVARFFEPVLANHDRDAVTSFCYSDVARPDEVTARLKGHAAEWRDTAGLSDGQLAHLVRQDRIDVLVDLTGHMGGGRLLAFARKPAPVQATYLGYPHSTGVGAIDYRLTDAVADPPGTTERYHVEQLVRLEGCAWCYKPDDGLPPPDDPPALRDGFVTFGSFNRMAKLTPPVASLWARVLEAVPRSRLMVLAAGGDANAPVRRMLESAGVPSDRLRLVPSGSRAQYLDLCLRADVGLDPFPYNGMTTTCDLLWVGVPTVTLAGTSHRARVGASLNAAVGLAELVARTEDEYVSIASALAADRGRLRALRRSLRDRTAASALCDGRGVAARLEAAFRDMCDTRR